MAEVERGIEIPAKKNDISKVLVKDVNVSTLTLKIFIFFFNIKESIQNIQCFI